jgi:hypothetical protein
MSDESVSLCDTKIASLEESILKCEVQLQKAKRQCDSLSATAAAGHHDKVPQVFYHDKVPQVFFSFFG